MKRIVALACIMAFGLAGVAVAADKKPAAPKELDFAAIDINKDGKIVKEEFLKVCPQGNAVYIKIDSKGEGLDKAAFDAAKAELDKACGAKK